MRATLLRVLACPDCGSALDSEREALVCAGCSRRFPVSRGVPRLLPSERLGEEWERKQELGRAEYETAANGAGEDDLARRFAGFAQLRGLVLDIGCGITRRPAYLEDNAQATYVGVDPLDGSVDREFDFVRGVGEHLPFRSATFDRVISATALDHVRNPRRVLEEARRVLKADGILALWVGVVDDDDLRANVCGPFVLPERLALRELLRRHGLLGLALRAFRHLLVNRLRALRARSRLRLRREDVVAEVYAERARYHLRFFEAEDVISLLRQTGFSVLATERVDTPGEGSSLFVPARRDEES